MNAPQRQTVAQSGRNQFPAVTALAGFALGQSGSATQVTPGATPNVTPANGVDIWAELRSMSDIFDQATARQVISAGLTNSPLTQNPFLTSNQMAVMQEQFRQGVKVFLLRDSARCFMIPVQQLSDQEQTTLARLFSNCVGR